jgi:hypothetical protein
MKRRSSIIVLIWLFGVLASPAYAADPVSQNQSEDFRATPNPFRLLANQWAAYSPPAGYSLEFLRTQ